MVQSQFISKISSFSVWQPAKFNPTLSAYRSLLVGAIFSGFSFWGSFENYQQQKSKKIAIENLLPQSIEKLSIGSNLIEVSQKSE